MSLDLRNATRKERRDVLALLAKLVESPPNSLVHEDDVAAQMALGKEDFSQALQVLVELGLVQCTLASPSQGRRLLVNEKGREVCEREKGKTEPWPKRFLTGALAVAGLLTFWSLISGEPLIPFLLATLGAIHFGWYLLLLGLVALTATLLWLVRAWRRRRFGTGSSVPSILDTDN